MTKKALLLLVAALLTLTALAIPVMAEEQEDFHSDLLVAIYPQTNVICMNERYKFRFCRICLAFIDVDTELPIGHDFGEWEETTKATCEKDGEQTQKCTGYKCTEVKKKKIDKLGGTCDWFNQANITQATCTEDAYRHSYCKKCGDTRKLPADPPQAALGHDKTGATIIRVPATTTAKGYQEFTCKRCNVKVKQYEHDAAKCGNDNTETNRDLWKWNDKGSVLPTCTEDGVDKKECNVCGRLKDTVVPKGHTWTTHTDLSHRCAKCPVVEQHSNWTKIDGGKHKCPVCNYEEGHKNWVKIDAAKHKCSICNYEEKHECKDTGTSKKCKCGEEAVPHSYKNESDGEDE